jgi:hypothetical protein
MAKASKEQDFVGLINPQLLLDLGDQVLPLKWVQDASAAHGDGDVVDRDVQQLTNLLNDANISTGDFEKD